MENRTQLALARYKAGFACSQAVLSVFAADRGLSADLAVRLAAPLGGGISRRGQVCGAVSGALLALGLYASNGRGEDRDNREHVYRLSQLFMERFQARHTFLRCPDLLGIAINTPEGLQQARQDGVFDRACPPLVSGAVEILEQLLQENHWLV